MNGNMRYLKSFAAKHCIAACMLAAVTGILCAQPSQLQIQTIAPPAPVGGGSITGATGGTTVFYWIVARYPAGNVQSQPIQIPNTIGAQNFNAQNFVTLQWGGLAGTTGYDVVRNTTAQFPAPCNACAVAVNTTSTTVQDTGGGSAYTSSSAAGAALATLFVNNISAALPALDVTINGVTYQIAPPANTGGGNLFGAGVPSNSLCVLPGLGYINTLNGAFYTCLQPASGTWVLSGGGGPPTGAASGDLSGSYPNPVVSHVNGLPPGGTCTNQFTRSINSSAQPVCASIATADLPITTVAPGAYTLGNFTVDATGRLTAASSTTLPGATGALLYNNGGVLGGVTGVSGQLLIAQPSGPPAFQTVSGACTINASGVMVCSGTGVSSFSGDGTFALNSASTGAITLQLATAPAHTFWMNNTGGTAAAGYQFAAAADLPAALVYNNQANTYTTGLQSFAAADLLAPKHTSDPGTCTAGQFEFNTTGTVFKGCTAANTWTAFATGATVTWQLAGSTVVSSTTFNDPGTGSGITHTFTNVGGVATYSPSVNFDVVPSIAAAQSGALTYCHSTNGTTVFTCTLANTGSAALTVYTAGMIVPVVTDTSTTTTATANVNTLGALTLTQSDCSTAIGASITANRMSLFWYNGAVLCLINGSGGGGSGTVTSVSFTGGIVSVATPTTTPAFTVAMTSGGIVYGTSTTTWASSALLGANLPVFGGGAGTAPFTGTRSGNTTEVATTTGTQGNGDIVKIDANGNHIDSGVPCCSTGTGTGVFPPVGVLPPAAGVPVIPTGEPYCSSGASPAVCGGNRTGVVAIPTGVNPTLVVNTTALGPGARVVLQEDESNAPAGGVTCNTTLGTASVLPVVTARTTGTSFTISFNGTITANPACVAFTIVN